MLRFNLFEHQFKQRVVRLISGQSILVLNVNRSKHILTFYLKTLILTNY